MKRSPRLVRRDAGGAKPAPRNRGGLFSFWRGRTRLAGRWLALLGRVAASAAPRFPRRLRRSRPRSLEIDRGGRILHATGRGEWPMGFCRRAVRRGSLGKLHDQPPTRTLATRTDSGGRRRRRKSTDGDHFPRNRGRRVADWICRGRGVPPNLRRKPMTTELIRFSRFRCSQTRSGEVNCGGGVAASPRLGGRPPGVDHLHRLVTENFNAPRCGRA